MSQGDREGEFKPKLIPKYQREISGIEEKVSSLYARGMSTRDIYDQIQELYGMDLSVEISRVCQVKCVSFFVFYQLLHSTADFYRKIS